MGDAKNQRTGSDIRIGSARSTPGTLAASDETPSDFPLPNSYTLFGHQRCPLGTTNVP
jgi:hypothetical protein